LLIFQSCFVVSISLIDKLSHNDQPQSKLT
jgi:hypothetical protein